MKAQPLGRYLLNESLPDEFKIEGTITQKEFKQKMNALAKKDPALYVNVIQTLKRMGDSLATWEGLSVGLDDVAPDKDPRNKFIREVEHKYDAATTDAQKRQIVENAQEQAIQITMKHPGSMTQQVQSGARGSPSQYSKIVVSPIAARDPQGKTVPWLITKSYSEGLKPSDYWVAGNEAILDTIKSTVSVSEPGELAKILINNVSDQIITEEDCGTQNGILMDVNDPHIIDRFLARDTAAAKRNTLITPEIQNRLVKGRVTTITVRSPMTCEAGDGICQKCQGLNEFGQLHMPGTNIGIRAAQAISEPLTQFALSAKHGIRTAKGEQKQVHGIVGFRQIIESPQKFVNQSTLAELGGEITKIEPAPQGGHFVYVNDEKHYINPNFDVLVKKNQIVEPGDMLSEGIPKPEEVVRLKGLAAGRQYLVDSLTNLYKNQGYDIDKRHFELLAKGELNYVQILNDPSNTFIKGDIVSYNNLRKELAKDSKHIDLEDALGEPLGKEYFHFSAGTRVTPSMVSFLKKHKISQVYVAPHAPEVEFIMKPATRAPLLNPDWMARLAHRNLKATLEQAAHFGDASNLHGTHPVPAYAYGVEFGKGKKGQY